MSVCVLGSINLDIVCTVTELPMAGETVSALGMARYTGGKGANQAVASALWGAPTRLIGAVGDDEPAEVLLGRLRQAGVDVGAIARTPGQPTGQAHICVSAGGENMIVVIGGANRMVDAAQVKSADLTACRVFLSQLETPLAAIEALFSSAPAAAGIRILNAAPALAEAAALFPLADIVVVNQTELARYAGISDVGSSATDIDAAARRLLSRAGQTVVVTLGAAGARVVDDRSSLSIAGLAARVVDTTGAGDCFCGVMAAALYEGASLPEAITLANAAAAVSTEHPGASAPADLRALATGR